MTKPGTNPSGGTLQVYDDYDHTSFDWNDDYVDTDYFGLADFPENPFHYEGSDHYEVDVLAEDYCQVDFMAMT